MPSDFRFPSSIRHLLACSTVVTLARSMTTPVLVLALSRQLHLDAAGVGLLIATALTAATVLNLYGGHLVDRWPARRLMLGSLAGIVLGLAGLPLATHPAGALALMLLLETSSGVFGIAVRTALSDGLPPAQRVRAFSLRYTLINLAFTVGPWAGSAMAGWSDVGPFWLAAAVAGAAMAGASRLQIAPRSHEDRPTHGFMQTLARLASDRALVQFTLGSMLMGMVYSRYAAYLSMVLLVRHSPAETLRWMSALLACNAMTVVALQWLVGRWIRQRHLLRWIGAGGVLLALSLAGLAQADSLVAWCAAMFVFTLGEIVLVPATMLWIDMAAPPALKGSYTAAQNLSQLGSALSPALCGALLAHGSPALLFAVLTGMVLLGTLLAVTSRSRADEPAATPPATIARPAA